MGNVETWDKKEVVLNMDLLTVWSLTFVLCFCGAFGSPVDKFEDLLPSSSIDSKNDFDTVKRSIGLSSKDNVGITEDDNLKEDSATDKVDKDLTLHQTPAEDRIFLLQKILLANALNTNNPSPAPEQETSGEYKVVRCFQVPRIVSCEAGSGDPSDPFQNCDTVNDRECFLFTYDLPFST